MAVGNDPSSAEIDIDRSRQTLARFMTCHGPGAARAVGLEGASDGAADIATPEPALDGDAPEPKYDIGKVVARGGMGAILDVKDRDIRRRVAMKVMLDRKREDQDAVLRFIEEAQITGQLEHPSIVPVHELSADQEGQVFYTMKYVQGITLGEIIEGIRNGKHSILRSYPLSHLLNIFLKACDAIAFAHTKGVIHRDLKPENIMVGEFGEVLVMDWGLAKVLRAEDGRMKDERKKGSPGLQPSSFSPQPSKVDSVRLDEDADVFKTMDGEIMGTPHFMAPEQAEGRIDELDARTDIYSLGAILYNILTLFPPVEGDSMNQVLQNVSDGNITPPTHVTLSSSGAAARRSQAGNGGSTDKGTDLKTIQARAAKSARAAKNGSARQAAFPHCPNGVLPPALSAVAMKALSYSPADRYPTVQELQADIERYQSGFATSAEEAGLGRQLQLLVNRHKPLVVAAISVTVAVIAGLAVSLVQWRRAVTNERRAIEHKHAALELKAKAEENEQAALQAREVAVAAKAEADLRRNEAEYEVYRSSIQLAATHLDNGNTAAAQELLDSCPQQYRNWEWGFLRNHCAKAVEMSFKVENYAKMDVSPKGTFLVTAGLNSTINIRNLQTGKTIRTLPAKTKGGRKEVAMLPNGMCLIACSTPTERLQLHDIRSGDVVWSTPVRCGYHLHLAVAAGGKQAVTTPNLSNEPASVWDLETGEIERTLGPPHGVFAGVACPPDKACVFLGEGGKGSLYSLRTGEKLREYRIRTGQVSLAAFSPDGKSVAGAAGNTVYLWDTDSAKQLLILGGHGGRVTALCFSHDGRHIITASGDRITRIWDSRDGALKAMVSGDVSECVAQTPDGKSLLVGFKDGTVRSLPLQRLLQGSLYTTKIKMPSGGGTTLYPSTDGSIFFGLGGSKGIIGDTNTGGLWTTWSLGESHDLCSVLTPDKSRVVIAHLSGTVKVWDAAGGKALRTLATYPNTDRTLCLATDGKHVFSGLPSSGKIDVWDIETGERVAQLESPLSRTRSIRMTHDSKTLIAAGRGIAAWDAGTLRERPLSCNVTHFISSFVLSPDDRLVATVHGVYAAVYDLGSGVLRCELRGHTGGIQSVAFGKDGRRLVSGGDDQQTAVWDTETGKRLLTLTEHTGRIRGVLFSADGRKLLTTAEDGLLIVHKATPWEAPASAEP